jgi:hypothetical protein
VTVTLTERGRAVARLSPRCVDALRRDFAAVVAATPTSRRGRYLLAAGGYVGSFTAGGTAFTIRPKYPLTFLDGPGREAGDGGDIAVTLARRLTRELRELTAAGLLRGYREEELTTHAVRGRIDFAKSMRTPGGPLTVIADEFTLDHPLNTISKAAALALLAGDLPPAVRGDLAATTVAFAGVNTAAPPLDQWPDPAAEPRTARYAPVFATARMVLAGTTRLFNLGAIFEAELTARLGGPRLLTQSPLPLTSPSGARNLRPDFVVLGKSGQPVAAWDAKWKTLLPDGPTDDDLHQVLGYAAALGVTRCGLVYPGCRARRRTWVAPSGVTVTAVALPVTGDPAHFDAAVRRLRRRLHATAA